MAPGWLPARVRQEILPAPVHHRDGSIVFNLQGASAGRCACAEHAAASKKTMPRVDE